MSSIIPCQQYNLEKVTIEDWPIDYTIHPVNLSYISINTLIKVVELFFLISEYKYRIYI